MLEHYLTATFRSYAKAPFGTSVAITVLAIGFAAFVAAYAVVEFWSRADQYLLRSDGVFFVTTDLLIADDPDPPGVVPRSTYWLAQYLEADFAQIESVARVNLLTRTLAVSDGRERAARLRGYSADADFLEIFALPFVAGDARAALAAPRSVVLTEAAARAVFRGESALGRRVVLGGNLDATVTGVIAPIPEPTHMGRSASTPLQFDLLASRDVYETMFRADGGVAIADTPENWLWLPAHTYVMLREGERVAALAAIDALLRARAPTAPISWRFVDDYFREQYEPYARVSQIFTLLSGAALLMALLGLVAMAVQVTHRRQREMGVRKVLGATSNGIAWLLVRSLAQPVLVGGLLAWPAAQLMTTRYLNAFVDPIEQSPLIYLGALSLALVVAMLAIAAETLRAVRKRPADILRT